MYIYTAGRSSAEQNASQEPKEGSV